MGDQQPVGNRQAARRRLRRAALRLSAALAAHIQDAAEYGYSVAGIDVAWAAQEWVLPAPLHQTLKTYIDLWKEVHGT